MAASQLLPVANIATVARRGVRGEASRPVRAAGRQTAPTRLRLTRRGRLAVRVLGVLAFVLVVAAAVLLVNRPASAGTTAAPVAVSYRVVMPGETLLAIAAEVDPGSDARDTAVRIARLNALEGWGLRAGQRLALPVELRG